MKRFSSRDLILYLMLVLLMVFAVTTLQRMDPARDPTYGQVRTLFEQERVQSFSLEGNNLTLEVRGERRRHQHPPLRGGQPLCLLQ